MARKPRLEFPGAFYHVITRGNNRQKIFIDDKDYQNFLERLKFYKERFEFTLYAYALMPNHVHMLIESGEVPLSRIMQGLQFTYTQKFNRRYKKIGHLFQGRYKAILCQKEAYLLELIRYICLNPVRARLAERPMDWRWCSFNELFQSADKQIVSANKVLRLFGVKHGAAVKAFQKYINEGLSDGHNDLYYKLKGQRILGDVDFADEVVKTNETNAGNFKYYNVDTESVAALVARHMNIDDEQIRSVTRERAGANARGVVAYICKTLCGKTIKEVGTYFGRGDAVFSRMIKKIEIERAKNNDLAKIIQQIEKEIKNSYRPCIMTTRGR